LRSSGFVEQPEAITAAISAQAWESRFGY